MGGELSARIRLVQQPGGLGWWPGLCPAEYPKRCKQLSPRAGGSARAAAASDTRSSPPGIHDIAENQIDAAAAAQDFECAPAVGRAHHVIAEPADRLQRDFQNTEIVLDDEDGSATAADGTIGLLTRPDPASSSCVLRGR